MSRLGRRVRLRMIIARTVPQTPSKRLAYGAALLAALAIGLKLAVIAGGGVLLLTFGVRFVDVQRSAARRPKFTGTRSYFFEGDGSSPDR